jgi:hypothetical protein
MLPVGRVLGRFTHPVIGRLTKEPAQVVAVIDLPLNPESVFFFRNDEAVGHVDLYGARYLKVQDGDGSYTEWV